MALLLLMHATLPISQCERSCLDRVGQYKQGWLLSKQGWLLSKQGWLLCRARMLPRRPMLGLPRAQMWSAGAMRARSVPTAKKAIYRCPFDAVVTQYLLCLVQATLDLLREAKLAVCTA